jgi:hypothetical protein
MSLIELFIKFCYNIYRKGKGDVMNGIIYDGGEEFVIHRNYAEQFLRDCEAMVEDKEYHDYMVESDNFLLNEIKKMPDEYIGLSIHAMDDCFYINQSLLEWIEEE